MVLIPRRYAWRSGTRPRCDGDIRPREAADPCGQVCFGIEIDPLFVDLAIRRWQAFTEEKAKRANDGVPFEALVPEIKPVEEAL
jgi:hypothetical protein